MDKALIEQQLAELPLFQYAWITTSELVFSERVRWICQTQCPMYNTTWACPPAVGTVEECKARCLSYPHALMMTSITEVSDIANLEETLATRAPHEELTRQVRDMIAEQSSEVMALSTEACAICQKCAYPDVPCVESQGILVTDLAEKHGLDFMNGNIVVWFSLILFK